MADEVEIANAREQEQRDVMKRIQHDGVCPFCWKYMPSYHKNPILRKTDHWLYTRNAWPYPHTKHHFILVPKSHISTPTEMNTEQWAGLQEMIDFISKEHEIVDATCLMRFGEMKETGATVRHLHAHIIVGDGLEPVTTRVG